MVAASGGHNARIHFLKLGKCFAALDGSGDILAAGAGGPAVEGLFLDDTRFLSRLVITVNGARPLLLSSSVQTGNEALVVDLANPSPAAPDRPELPRDTIHIRKEIRVADNEMLLRMAVRNYGSSPVSLALELEFDADFADIFELRGTPRQVRGERLADLAAAGGPDLVYFGADGVVRRTCLAFDPPPRRIGERRASWDVRLQPRDALGLKVSARCETAALPSAARAGVQASAPPTRHAASAAPCIQTDDSALNELFARSLADLKILATDTPQGIYPYAGLPWFAAPFGRDGLVTALQCLWLDPTLAAGTLRFLATHQARTADERADAEPGKILHEMRSGEMASLGDVPFGRYYGSVDATPLFVVLAAAYHARTGDLDLMRELWPNLEAALGWMRDYGDPDRDGFLEYHRKSADGLVNQGWKDSGDAISHADGTLAEPPVALVEVQAYAYAAYEGGARIARALGDERRSAELAAAALRLKQQFDGAFWIEELGTYALALDGAKRPCRVRASNAGQVLFGGIATPQRAIRVAKALMQPPLFSGWGIRTLAEGEARYNPISYHNGSVWPHDNGLIVMGFGRYGLKQPAANLLTGFADAAAFMEMRRLPEFICGFSRCPSMGPTFHPNACAPQAWAATSIIGMLGALLGLSFDPQRRRVALDAPFLPPGAGTLRVSHLPLGMAAVGFTLERRGDVVVLSDVRRDGDIDIGIVT